MRSSHTTLLLVALLSVVVVTTAAAAAPSPAKKSAAAKAPAKTAATPTAPKTPSCVFPHLPSSFVVKPMEGAGSGTDWIVTAIGETQKMYGAAKLFIPLDQGWSATGTFVWMNETQTKVNFMRGTTHGFAPNWGPESIVDCTGKVLAKFKLQTVKSDIRELIIMDGAGTVVATTKPAKSGYNLAIEAPGTHKVLATITKSHKIQIVQKHSGATGLAVDDRVLVFLAANNAYVAQAVQAVIGEGSSSGFLIILFSAVLSIVIIIMGIYCVFKRKADYQED